MARLRIERSANLPGVGVYQPNGQFKMDVCLYYSLDRQIRQVDLTAHFVKKELCPNKIGLLCNNVLYLQRLGRQIDPDEYADEN